MFISEKISKKKRGQIMYYEEKKKNKEKLILYLLMVVIIALLFILIIKSEVGDISAVNQYQAQKVNFDENDGEETKPPNSTNLKSIDQSVKAIVGISKLKQSGSSIFVNNAEQKLGLGSGVVITDNGYILTNQHVSRQQIQQLLRHTR